MDDDIWVLISRCVFGEAGTEEKQRLQQLLKENPLLQQQYDLLSQVIRNDAPGDGATPDSYEPAALNLLAKAEKMDLEAVPVRSLGRSKKARYWWVAASVAGFIGVSVIFFYNGNRKQSDPVTVAGIARNGERKTLQLPDGTRVWLNAGSELSYLPGFGAATREVILEGEAFFDVVENKSIPFIVHAQHVQVKVLGTAFNVKAYDEDEAVTTSLYRGLVSVTREGEGEKNQPILLYPHQELIVPAGDAADNSSPVGSIKELPPVKVEFLDSTRTDSSRVETSWIYNRLEFRGDDFKTLARKMEHWFNVRIHIEDPQLQKLSFDGSFETERLDQAMKALQLANPFKYKIENNEVFIYPAP